MDYKQDPLWERIDAFDFDDPQAQFPFSKKLASENNWPAHFARRALAEYKRFIYLCVISPNPVSPPPVVDQVWHLHLTYTDNYWNKWCVETLHKTIHHTPGKGGQEQHDYFKQMYKDTLELYHKVYDEESPGDIWEIPDNPVVIQKEKEMNIGKYVMGAIMFCIGLCAIAAGNVFAAFFIAVLLLVILSGANVNGQGTAGGCGAGGDGGGGDGGGCGGGCGGCGD